MFVPANRSEPLNTRDAGIQFWRCQQHTMTWKHNPAHCILLQAIFLFLVVQRLRHLTAPGVIISWVRCFIRFVPHPCILYTTINTASYICWTCAHCLVNVCKFLNKTVQCFYLKTCCTFLKIFFHILLSIFYLCFLFLSWFSTGVSTTDKHN